MEIEETQQNKDRHTPPVMPPQMINKKEDHKCAVRVNETELGNKCVGTLKKYQVRLSRHGLQRLYRNIKSKAENYDVQIGLNVKIIPRHHWTFH